MKKNGKYRFSLQFGMESEEECRAGEFLERLGNRKSTVIVSALNEYLDLHPELGSECKRIKVEFGAFSKDELRNMILQIIEEQAGDRRQKFEEHTEEDIPSSIEICDDIMDMLNDLESFNI